MVADQWNPGERWSRSSHMGLPLIFLGHYDFPYEVLTVLEGAIFRQRDSIGFGPS